MLGTFSSAVTTPLPVANDFSLSDSHNIVGEVIAPATPSGGVLASDYTLYTTGGTPVGIYAFCNKGDLTRAWQRGTITDIEFNNTAAVSSGTVYFCVFKANATLKQKVAITSSLGVTGVIKIHLSSSVDVLPGEMTGFSMVGTTAFAPYAIATSGTSGNEGVYYVATTAEDINETVPQLAYSVPVRLFLQSAPMFVMYGDSRLAGFAGGNEPFILNERLKTQNSPAYLIGAYFNRPYQENSMSGNSVTDVIHGAGTGLAALAPYAAVNRNAAYYFIGGDINDITAGSPATVSQVLAGYTSIITALITANPSVKIIIVGGFPYDNSTAVYAQLKQLNDGYTAFATTYAGNVWHLDVSTLLGVANGLWFTYAGGLSSDGLHPNTTGDAIVADACIALVRSITPVSQVSSTVLGFRMQRSVTYTDVQDLSFTAVTNPIKGSNGATITSIASRAVTNNITPAPETPNWIEKNAGGYGYMADKRGITTGDTYIEFQVVGGVLFHVGFVENATDFDSFNTGVSSAQTFFKVCAWIDGSGFNVKDGAAGTVTGVTVTGTWFRIWRISGDWKLWQSSDGVTWTVAYDLTYTNTGHVYYGYFYAIEDDLIFGVESY